MSIDAVRQRADRDHLRMCGHHRMLALEPLRMDDVVCVHPRDQWRPRLLDHGIRASDQPEGAGALENAHARIRRGVASQDLPRIVGRAVLERHQLEVRERLAQDAAHAVVQEARRVVHRHDHAHRRRRARGAGGKAAHPAADTASDPSRASRNR
jgi:hypothetical protein